MRKMTNFDAIERRKKAASRVLDSLIVVCKSQNCSVKSTQSPLTDGFCTSCIKGKAEREQKEAEAATYYQKHSEFDFS